MFISSRLYRVSDCVGGSFWFLNWWNLEKTQSCGLIYISQPGRIILSRNLIVQPLHDNRGYCCRGLLSVWRKQVKLKKQVAAQWLQGESVNCESRGCLWRPHSSESVMATAREYATKYSKSLITQCKHWWLETLIISLIHNRLSGLAVDAERPPATRLLKPGFDVVCLWLKEIGAPCRHRCC